MSRLKLPPELTERLRKALGGRNITPRKLEALLDRVEQAETVTATETVTEKIVEKMADPHTVVALGSPLTVPVVETVTEPTVPAGWSTEREALYAALRNMEQKIAELKSPAKTAEEKDQAIGDGKLPVTTQSAPPVGYAAFTDLPMGKWVTSPLGPKVPYKLCGCGKCTKVRLLHWFCVICRSGPHAYQGRYPFYTKMWTAPGSVWGVAHNACSSQCWMQYLGMIGVAPGVNDAEPPTQKVGDEAALPEKPVTAFDSD